MTNDELKIYYADLLASQYRDKPKAYATVKAIIDILIMNQLAQQVKDAFNLDTAIGVQLDTLGKYQGVTRYSFGPNGNFTLSDSDYRLLIKMAIVKNSSDSSLYKIQELLNNFFPDVIQVFDTQNMKMHYLIDLLSENLIYAFVNQLTLPKPMGVQLVGVFFIDSIKKVFGFSSKNGLNTKVVGLNSAITHDPTTHFLSKNDILFI